MSMIADGQLSIAICDRCRTKLPYQMLRPDGNSPGLKVCGECWDTIDPYRLPPRQPDPLTLQHPRPDTSIADNSVYLGTSPEGNWYITDNNNNLLVAS